MPDSDTDTLLLIDAHKMQVQVALSKRLWGTVKTVTHTRLCTHSGEGGFGENTPFRRRRAWGTGRGRGRSGVPCGVRALLFFACDFTLSLTVTLNEDIRPSKNIIRTFNRFRPFRPTNTPPTTDRNYSLNRKELRYSNARFFSV